MTIKVAVVTPVISHFEAPLFRLLSAMPDLEVCVFHADPLLRDHYDPAYQTKIDWGEDLSVGYRHQAFDDMGAAVRAAIAEFKPASLLEYGYSWNGAMEILLAAKARGIKVVHRGLLSPVPDPRSPVASPLKRILRPPLLHLYDAHHYGGTFSRKVLRDALIPERRCYFVPFSVDTPYFAAHAEDPEQVAQAKAHRAAWDWADSDPVAIFIGQHSWVKAPDTMLDLFARAQSRVPNLKLVMVGSGPMTEDLKRTAEATLAPNSWRFTGYVPSKATTPYYLAADVAVFPSRYETWARAVNEAMLCRRPCVLTDRIAASGGLVTDGQTGFVARGHSAEGLADKLVGFLNMTPQARNALGEAARSRALEFSYEAHITELHASVTECLA